MSGPDAFQRDLGQPQAGPSRPGGLMDLLGVAAVVLDSQGRIVLWSPQAEELFGYTAKEALGQYAAYWSTKSTSTSYSPSSRRS